MHVDITVIAALTVFCGFSVLVNLILLGFMFRLYTEFFKERVKK